MILILTVAAPPLEMIMILILTALDSCENDYDSHSHRPRPWHAFMRQGA
jgi:hypothetical protein